MTLPTLPHAPDWLLPTAAAVAGWLTETPKTLWLRSAPVRRASIVLFRLLKGASTMSNVLQFAQQAIAAGEAALAIEQIETNSTLTAEQKKERAIPALEKLIVAVGVLTNKEAAAQKIASSSLLPDLYDGAMVALGIAEAVAPALEAAATAKVVAQGHSAQ